MPNDTMGSDKIQSVAHEIISRGCDLGIDDVIDIRIIIAHD